MFDAIIVGGGPAGLAAAQQFARGCAPALLLDAGVPRNDRADYVNGYLGLDHVTPATFRERSRAGLTRYPHVQVLDAWVDAVIPTDGGFTVTAGERSWRAHRILLTTGVVDIPPDLPDVERYWGSSIVQCPFCHGWEARGEAAAILLDDDTMLAEMLRFYGRWAPRLVAIASRGYLPTARALEVLRTADVPLHTSPVTRLHGVGRRLESIEFANGDRAAVSTLYLHNEQQPTQLVRDLGLTLTLGAYVLVDKDYTSKDPTGPPFRTSLPGVYAAGDATSMAQAAQLAAFEGALAARRIIMELAFEAGGR